jgi:uncharacterized glyoxalase superfamily protein PhnB
MSQNTPVIYPALSYQDARAAIDFLTRAFGFEELMVVPGENGSIVHAELNLGPAVVMLGSNKPVMGFVSPRDLPAVNSTLYVAIDDPDAHYQRAKSAGAEITRELNDTDYGSREYGAKDPEGHHWFFGTYRPAAPAG